MADEYAPSKLTVYFEFCIQMYKKTYITMEFRDLYVSFCCNEKIDLDHLET